MRLTNKIISLFLKIKVLFFNFSYFNKIRVKWRLAKANRS